MLQPAPTPTVVPLDFGTPQHLHLQHNPSPYSIGQSAVQYEYDDSSDDDEDSDEDLSASVDGSMTVSEANKAPWVVRANACAMEADQASRKKKWRRAMRKHQKAAEWYQYAMEDTFHPDMKRDLFALSQNHNHKAMELRRFLENEASRLQQQQEQHDNRGFVGGMGMGQVNNIDSSRYYDSELDYSSISPEAAEELNAILGAWRSPGGMPEKVERDESWFKEGFWFTVEKLFQDFFPKLPTTIVTSPRSSVADASLYSTGGVMKRRDPLRVSDDEWVQTSTAPTPPPRSSLRLESPPLYPGRSNSGSSIPDEDDLTSSSFFLVNVSGDHPHHRTSPGKRNLTTSEEKLSTCSPTSSSPPPPLSANSSVSSLSTSDQLKQQPGTVSGQTIYFEDKPAMIRNLGQEENELQKLSSSELIQEVLNLRERLRYLTLENERLSRAQQEGARLLQENESLKSSVIRFRDEIQKKANHFRHYNPHSSRFGSMTTLPNISASVMDPSSSTAGNTTAASSMYSMNPASASVMNPRRITSPDRTALPLLRRPSSPSVAALSGMMTSGITSPKSPQYPPLSTVPFASVAPITPTTAAMGGNNNNPSSTPSPSSLEPRVHELEALVSHLSSNLDEMTNRYCQAEQALRRYEQWRNKLNFTAQKKKKNTQTQRIAEQLGIPTHDPSTSISSASASTFPSLSQSCCPSTSTSFLPPSSSSSSSSSSDQSLSSQSQYLPSSSSSVLSTFDPTISSATGLEPLLSTARLSDSSLNSSSSSSLSNTSLLQPSSSSPPSTFQLTGPKSIPVSIPVHHTFSSSPPSLSPI